MPKPIQQKLVLKVLRAKGFIFVSQKGSHAKFRKIGNPTRTVIVKMGKKKSPMAHFNPSCFCPDFKKMILGKNKLSLMAHCMQSDAKCLADT